MQPHLNWDLYCRVIDNHGDVGVCWRLAADLAARGEHVRLWIDDASALAWMAPGGADRVTVHPWPEERTDADTDTPAADVVMEAFGCALPPAAIGRMSARTVWINLEYLSAETVVERNHRLPSPQPGGQRKWFFYPGFTPQTGGLIREPDLAERMATFDAGKWLAAAGLTRRVDEQVVSLFCYEQLALARLIETLSQRPTLLLATPGHATRQVSTMLGPALRQGQLRAVLLPPLTQRDYDHLLWASDLNFVRGEDSFVRAQWAGKPFVWQIYPQGDGVHVDKLAAFTDRFSRNTTPDLAAYLRQTFSAWNAGDAPFPDQAHMDAWRTHCALWGADLRSQTDLTSQLMGFVAETR